ncbi:zinc-binding dehydrogenase [Georgenia thermotolerans]|uniref:alcohol dehydrogenase n=1 Tax=Georgenia thermotolerans TaxID=527326 RepID=A0A7J5UTB8_9MICO|nr:zinc-binding dehydrogenase [Georgenia thermotolerans]KAE8765528.1 alcohol dehydrogenase catalytic domain-containing protein [Georgenia thermotolerans]
MKAWQFIATGAPLELREVPEPVAGPGEVVVEIRAAGLCHTDVGVMTDPLWRAQLATVPLTLGHEVAGVVVEVGPGVDGAELGARVGINPLSATAPGFGRDGGYSHRAVARAEDLVPIPDNVSFAQGAAGTDAGMTSYHAVVVEGQVGAGSKVGIVGLGGLGQLGAAFARAVGAEVYVAEVNEAVWPLARELGAREVVRDVLDLKAFQPDVVVDFAGFGTTAGAMEAVRPGGRVVQVGMGTLEATISINTLILNTVTLVGSKGGTNADIAAVYELFASGTVDPLLTTIGFDEIPDGLERLRVGGVAGRLVAVP